MKNLCKYLSVLFMSCLIAISPATSIASQAACSHSWSAYAFNAGWFEDPSSIGKCMVRVTESVRTCENCGDLQFRAVRKQLTHSYGSDRMCLNGCGMGYARSPIPYLVD